MRLPKKPPALSDLPPKLFEGAGARKMLELMVSSGIGPLVHEKYLHWDDLLRRGPPAGLTHEAWWYLIRTRRQSLAKTFPLRSTEGSLFTFSMVDPIPERLQEIDLRAGGNIRMPEPVTNPETRDQYYVSSLIEEAITSSQLEGATTTRLVAKEMLRTGRPPRDRSERMILNNYRTMQRVRELKDEPLSTELVFELHRLVTEETLDDPSAAGRLRRKEEPVVVEDQYGEVLHRPPPALELTSRLETLCAFANESRVGTGFVHPVLRSIILHFWLAYDHPFVDGNGRCARALFYWSMLRNGYWLVEFISISQILVRAPARYGRAFLLTETDDNDTTYFLLHQLEVLRRSIESLHEYIARKASELTQLQAELRGTAFLNHRQRAIVIHALRHPGKVYTVEEHRRSHDVVYETARTDLIDLQEKGLFTGSRRGKKLLFTAASELRSRLQRLR